MMEREVKVKPEFKKDPEVKGEHYVKAEPEVKVQQELKAEPEIIPEPEVKVEPEVKIETEVKVVPDVKIEPEVKVDLEANVGPEVSLNPEVMAELEVNVEPEVQEETEPEVFNVKEVQEKFQVQMNLEHDMERKYEMVGEPIMELEPVDDGDTVGEELSDTELSTLEKSLRAAFQNQDQPPPKEEGPMRKPNYVSDGEPIMELEPETGEEPFLHQEVMRDAAIMEEDIMGQQRPSLEEDLPKEAVRMEMELGKQQDDIEDKQATGWSCCPGVVLEGKRYQFFKGPKTAADAQLFCQKHFLSGQLASITSQHIHREVMNMMLKQNGAYTRTWIGGLRNSETGRFIWLDGSHWGYADWLSGEPNNTEYMEDCVEVLSGNGKFNDFTCWEPQAFICSHPH